MDISSDALLEALFSQPGVGVGVCDADGRLRGFNPALESMMGPVLPLCSQEEWGTAYHLFEARGIRPLQREEIPLVRALDGHVVADATITTCRPGRPVRALRCTAVPLREGEQGAGALVLVTDVGHRPEQSDVRSEAGLANALVRMSRLQEWSLRVGTITELQMRTPLTMIAGNVETMEDRAGDLPVPVRRALRATRRGLDSLTEALTALSYANDLVRTAEPHLEPIDLVDIAQRARLVFRAAHLTPGVHLSTGTGHAVHAHADPSLVRRAIVALIDAVVEPGTDAHVSLDVFERDRTVGVCVTGICVDSSTERTTNRVELGPSASNHGDLGLALAEAVALAHDGHLEIAEVATGTVATLLLSRAPQPRS